MFYNVKPNDWYFFLDLIRVRTELGCVRLMVGGPCDFSVSPSPFEILLVLTLGLWDFVLGLDNSCISDRRLVTCGQRVTMSGVMYQADIVTSDNALSGYNSLFKPRL